MSQRTVVYRGQVMAAGWPERIERAQHLMAYVLNGAICPRIRYGREEARLRAATSCGDCGVIEGEFHVPTCQHEECPRCHGQFLSCCCLRLAAGYDLEATH